MQLSIGLAAFPGVGRSHPALVLGGRDFTGFAPGLIWNAACDTSFVGACSLTEIHSARRLAYPAGSGSNYIRRTMTAKSRRVLQLCSARASQAPLSHSKASHAAR